MNNQGRYLYVPGKQRTLAIDLMTREVLALSNQCLLQFSSTKTEDVNIYEKFIERNESISSLSSWLFMTLDCDLACPYCFQSMGSCDNGTSMDEGTIDSIYSEIDFRAKSQTRQFEFVYFGGEPLLKFDVITYAMDCFNRRLDGKVRHKVITNGFSLTKNKVEKLLYYGMGVFQVTIDGTRDYHDSRRFTNSNRGTYDRIIGNIKEMLRINSNFNLIIRVNLDKANEGAVEGFLTKERQILSDSRVYIDLGKVNSHGFEMDYPELMLRDEFTNSYGSLIEKLYKLGLKAVPPYSGGCSLRTKSSLFFAPDGKIFKCPGRVHHILNSGITERNTIDLLPSIKNSCKSCEFLLICGGGCNLNGEFSREPACEKKFIEQELISYYRAKYCDLLS